MSKGWMRVREAAAMLSVSESTIRRRIAEGQFRGRSGKSGRQEVFIPAKLREQAQAGAEGVTHDTVTETDTRLSVSRAGDDGSILSDAPAFVSESPSESESDMLKRYERLAGGSLMLAQKRADELTQAASAAYENLAHAREQLRHVRKVAVAGWAVAGLILCLAFVLSLAFGIDSARARAAAQANQDAAEQAHREAQSLRKQLVVDQRESFTNADDAQASVKPD